MSIGDSPTQAEDLADDVRALATLVHAVRDGDGGVVRMVKALGARSSRWVRLVVTEQGSSLASLLAVRQ